MIHETVIETCSVRGVHLFEMRHVVDHVRGHLTALEFAQELPFVPQRIFMTYGMPSLCTRGEHAHRMCEQFLVCVKGECHVIVDDGENREEFCLNRPTFGLHVPPMVWAQEHQHSPDSVLMVLASRPYEVEDYIRDYRQFLSTLKEGIQITA